MTKLYDIHNPTPARRVIYDGITNVKAIIIPPKATLNGVPLADHIVERLNKRLNPEQTNALVVTLVGAVEPEAPEPVPPAAAKAPAEPVPPPKPQHRGPRPKGGRR